MNDSGFYRPNEDRTGMLFAPTRVLFPDGSYLLRSKHLTGEYTYPVQGWTWYNTSAEAYNAANIPLIQAQVDLNIDRASRPDPAGLKAAFLSDGSLLALWQKVNAKAFTNPPLSHAIFVFLASLENDPYIPNASKASLDSLLTIDGGTTGERAALNIALERFNMGFTV